MTLAGCQVPILMQSLAHDIPVQLVLQMSALRAMKVREVILHAIDEEDYVVSGSVIIGIGDAAYTALL
jgi:hypothetical protein